MRHTCNFSLYFSPRSFSLSPSFSLRYRYVCLSPPLTFPSFTLSHFHSLSLSLHSLPVSLDSTIRVCVFFCFLCLSVFSRVSVHRETRSTYSGCHAGWLPSPPGAICFSLSRRRGRLERLLVRGKAAHTAKLVRRAKKLHSAGVSGCKKGGRGREKGAHVTRGDHAVCRCPDWRRWSAILDRSRGLLKVRGF